MQEAGDKRSGTVCNSNSSNPNAHRGRGLGCWPPLLEDLWEGTSFSQKEFRLKAQLSQDAHPGLFSLFLGGSCHGLCPPCHCLPIVYTAPAECKSHHYQNYWSYSRCY